MAYVPPLNGGRINASIGGNSTSAGAGYSYISTGDMILAGGSNITLKQDGKTISFVGGAAGGTNTLGMSNLGNTAGATGVVTGSAFNYLLAGGNNVTLSQSLNGVSGTLTISAANQTNQTLGINVTSNTIQSNTGTVDARVLTFNGMGAASVGYSNGSIQVSAPSVSSVNAAGIVNISSNAGNVTISAPAFSAGVSNLSNDSGSTGMITNRLVLAGGSNITLSQSTNASGATVSINGGGGGGGAVTAGGTTYANGVSFSPSGALTLSGSSQTLSMSVPAQSSLSVTGALTLSTNGNTISIGAPAQSSLVGTNGIVLSSNGSTITINGLAPPISNWEYPTDVFTSLNTIGQGSLSLQRVFIPFTLIASAAKIGGSVSAGTSTANATGSINFSLQMGVYKLTGSTLTLVTSGSFNNAFSWQAASSVSSTSLTGVSGMRQLTTPLNLTGLPPGEYWVAALALSTITAPGGGFTLYGNTLMPGAAGGSMLAPIGSNSSAAPNLIPFQGVYSTSTSAMPSSIVSSNINFTSASNIQRANFYHAIYNASY